MSSESQTVSDCTSSCWFPKHARSRLPLAHGASVYQLMVPPYTSSGSSYLDHITCVSFFSSSQVTCPFFLLPCGTSVPCRRSSSQTAISNPNIARSWWLQKIKCASQPNQRIKTYRILCQKNIETNHEAGKERTTR